MSSLFEEDSSGEMSRSQMITTIRDAYEEKLSYEEKLLLNPPTPAFFATNPKHKGAARHAARRDVDRMLAVLGELGLTITQKPEGGT